MERGPIFIAGLERSGTSLLYALLASHPGIAMTRRTNLWRYFADQFGDLANDTNLDECLDKMRRYKRLVKLELDFPRLRADFLDGERTYPRLFRLIEEQVATRLGKTRWGDKSLNIERYTDQIMAAYAGARMLHMIRDPRDRYASVIARWKKRRGDVGAGTAAWLWSARLAQQNSAVYPDQYRIVRYESLVTDPTAELRAISAFIDEPYDHGMLSMEGATRFRDEGSNSSYGPRNVGSIAPDSVGRFRSVLTPRQISVIQSMAGKPMAALGYETDDVGLSLLGNVRLAAVDLPYNYTVNAAWRLREAAEDLRGRKLPDYRLVADSS